MTDEQIEKIAAAIKQAGRDIGSWIALGFMMLAIRNQFISCMAK